MIRTEVRDEQILWVTFDDPASRNAMDPETMEELVAAWRRFATDDSLRVAVITGAGDKSFCAGANLKKLVPKIQAGQLTAADNQEVYLKGEIDPIDKPIIAAINGDCMGGGFEVMLATDIRITADHARFGLPEVNWGLFPAGGGTVRLPRQVPRAIAMEILLSGEFFNADRAYELGLVNRVVPKDDLDEAAMAMAKRIARNGPLAVQRVKASVREGIDLPIDEAFEKELELADRVFADDEAAEGLEAFAAKRQPAF
ncbi:MAG: enoyl-CoA hydratase/isomerase family protein [Solirubrobacterales bacterium]|nr:enoyl-CoA hydratase/isomerase family protein [Solirubrobacterales bacterium]